MTSTWQQLLAALLAAVIPVIVALLNDWRAQLEAKGEPPAEAKAD